MHRHTDTDTDAHTVLLFLLHWGIKSHHFISSCHMLKGHTHFVSNLKHKKKKKTTNKNKVFFKPLSTKKSVQIVTVPMSDPGLMKQVNLMPRNLRSLNLPPPPPPPRPPFHSLPIEGDIYCSMTFTQPKSYFNMRSPCRPSG